MKLLVRENENLRPKPKVDSIGGDTGEAHQGQAAVPSFSQNPADFVRGHEQSDSLCLGGCGRLFGYTSWSQSI